MIFNYPIFRTRENFVHMVKNPYLEAQKAYAGFRPFLQNNTHKLNTTEPI